MNRLSTHVKIILGLLLVSVANVSCSDIDSGAEGRLPGLCLSRVTTCPPDVVPLGDYDGAVISAFNMPVYPHPDCRTISPNDRNARIACTTEKIIEFLDENLIYPEAAVKNAIEGPVTVSLIVSFPEGCLSDITVSGDLGYGTVCELQRVLTFMPSLESTREYSIPAHFSYRFRYHFTL